MKIGKSKVFLLLCGSFIAGIASGRILNFTVVAVGAMFFIGLTTIGWSDRRVRIAGFIGLIFFLGATRAIYDSRISDSQNFVGRYYGRELTMKGLIIEDPDNRSDKTNLVLQPIEIVGSNQKLEGKILINVGKYPEYAYGDLLQVTGKVEEPFETEEFSYKNYLSRYDIFALMRYPKIEKLASSQGNLIKSAILSLKNNFREKLSSLLPEPHNAFLLGLLLGLKRSLPDDLKEMFVITGVSHIVVVSGYNITVIARGLLKTRSYLGRRMALILSAIAIFSFVILTGAEASVVRAGVMGFLLVVALNVGRIYQVSNALIFAAAVMVAITPKILAFDIGFQLSFLATGGLILLAPIFDQWLSALPDFLGLRTNLSSTLAAQIFTLPLLVYYFDRISIIAPLVNVLILWAVPYTMLLGLTSGVGALIFPLLGLPFSWGAWALLEYMIRVVEFFARFPYAQSSASIARWQVVLYYGLLIGIIFIYRHRKQFFYQLEYVRNRI